MDNPKSPQDKFTEVLQDCIDYELDNKETFPPDIRQKIIDEYKKMYREKAEWLKRQSDEKKEEELS